jgi:hypothetical protein
MPYAPTGVKGSRERDKKFHTQNNCVCDNIGRSVSIIIYLFIYLFAKQGLNYKNPYYYTKTNILYDLK